MPLKKVRLPSGNLAVYETPHALPENIIKYGKHIATRFGANKDPSVKENFTWKIREGTSWRTATDDEYRAFAAIPLIGE